jgi:hypothetical protein
MATGATEFIDATTADVFIEEHWAAEAIVARESALVFAAISNRVFEKYFSIGDVIHIPSVGNLTATSKNVASNAATVFETVTESNTNLTVNTWRYSAIAVETYTAKATNRDLLATYAGKMGYALGLAHDDVLAGLPDNFSQTVGTLTVDLSYENFLRGRQYLDDADAPLEDRNIVVSPAAEEGMLQLDHFVNADYSRVNGETANRKDRGYVGSWLGMPVWKSVNVEGSNAAGHDNTMFQKEAIATVVMLKPRVHREFDINYLANKVAVEQVDGSGEIRDDHGVWLKGA